MAEPGDKQEPGPEVAEIDDRADEQIPWRVFGFVGTFVVLLTALYWFTSYEEAGTAMLALSGVLGLFCSVFLWRNLRKYEAGGSGHVGGDDGAMYLPEASPWPFGIGLGTAVILNGLLIGSWFLVPGVMVLGVSIAGFARQSRHRR